VTGPKSETKELAENSSLRRRDCTAVKQPLPHTGTAEAMLVNTRNQAMCTSHESRALRSRAASSYVYQGSQPIDTPGPPALHTPCRMPSPPNLSFSSALSLSCGMLANSQTSFGALDPKNATPQHACHMALSNVLPVKSARALEPMRCIACTNQQKDAEARGQSRAARQADQSGAMVCLICETYKKVRHRPCGGMTHTHERRTSTHTHAAESCNAIRTTGQQGLQYRTPGQRCAHPRQHTNTPSARAMCIRLSQTHAALHKAWPVLCRACCGATRAVGRQATVSTALTQS
jgi:hypothetical protein